MKLNETLRVVIVGSFVVFVVVAAISVVENAVDAVGVVEGVVAIAVEIVVVGSVVVVIIVDGAVVVVVVEGAVAILSFAVQRVLKQIDSLLSLKMSLAITHTRYLSYFLRLYFEIEIQSKLLKRIRFISSLKYLENGSARIFTDDINFSYFPHSLRVHLTSV